MSRPVFREWEQRNFDRAMDTIAERKTTNSTFYHDGDSDKRAGRPFSPPDVSVLAHEYTVGWKHAEGDMEYDALSR